MILMKKFNAERKIIMGEMTVKGYAERRVECDIVKYTLGFTADGMTIPEAVEAVNKELEHFLEIMENNGIKSDMFELEDNNTSERYSIDEGEKPYYSEREISIRMPLSTYNINSMMQYIAKYKLNVVLRETYYYSDLSDLHKELLKEAVEDSKNKAELIASFTGQKIKGIKSVITNFTEREMLLKSKRDEENRIYKIGEVAPSYAENLSSPTDVEKEDVEVVWLIED